MLKDKQVIQVPSSERATWIEHARQNDKHIIKHDYINDNLLVSTVFIGMKNQIFETAIFKKEKGEDDLFSDCEICATTNTYEEALEAHQQTYAIALRNAKTKAEE